MYEIPYCQENNKEGVHMSQEEGKEGKLGLAALTAMVVGSMVGAGIFMLPARFAGATGVWGALIAWLVAGTGMLMLAFVFQSLAVRKPHLDAGVFSYAREGFGDYAGFITAVGFWASACAGNVTYLVLIKSTLGAVFPILGSGDTIPALIVASIVIWIFFFLILRGVQQATFINTIVTIAKLIPIAVFILVSVFAFDPAIFMSNLAGASNGSVVPLFDQVSATMLITVFVFLGIEGASVYSRYAKTRRIVGSATIIGFVSVLCLLVLVSLLPYGIVSQEQIAALNQPSLGGVLELIIGVPGGILIGVGLIVSVLGAYLAWTLMAAEVIFAAAKSGDMPDVVSKVNDKNVPKTALLMSALLTQGILVITYFSEEALDFALDLTSALALLPFLLVAGYAVKIAFTKDGYEKISSGIRTRELIVAAIAVIYTIFLIGVAGLQFLPLCCILLAPATLLYYFARKGQRTQLFSTGEKILFVILCAGAVLAIVGIAMGWIVL